MRQPFGSAQAASSASSSPCGRGSLFGMAGEARCEGVGHRAHLRLSEIGGERGVLVGREDAELGHAVARLDVLAVADEAREVARRQRQRVDADRAAAAEMREIRADRAGRRRAADRVAGAAAGRDEQRLPAPLAARSPAPRAGAASRAQPGVDTRPAAWRRPRTPSAHAARRNTPRTGRDRCPAARRVSRRRVVRPGIMSTLPPRLGTQKLWITSADLQRELDRTPDRNADLVGARDRRRRRA